MDDSAMEAPAAAPAEAPAAAQIEGDVIHDKPGYLLLYYGPETTSEDRCELNLASCGSVLKELNQLAIDMDSFQIFEHNDILLKGGRGPIVGP